MSLSKKSKKGAVVDERASLKHPRIKVRSPDRATLTPREAAGVAGFGIAHTYNLLRKGKMPSIRVGKQFYIPRNALLKWLDETAAVAVAGVGAKKPGSAA